MNCRKKDFHLLKLDPLCIKVVFNCLLLFRSKVYQRNLTVHNLITFIITLSVRPQVSAASAYTAQEGQTVVLHCIILAANPAPSLKWTSPTLSTIPHTNGTITLPSVRRNQQGEYTCLSSNGVASVERKTYLTVNCMCFSATYVLTLGRLVISKRSLKTFEMVLIQ